MKFGPTATAGAAGAILAHTHRLPGGGALKKGRVLSGEDIERLLAAGVEEVVAARLEPGDLSEDAAARRLAEAARGPGVRVGDATTGRCNLFSVHRGLFVYDADRVDAANLVDEALTLGTLGNFSVVEANAMVATVKIIPFGVAESLADRAAASMTGLLEVRPFVPRRAGLITTVLPGVHDKQLERAASSQGMRVAYLGGEVAASVRCTHREADVAEHIDRMYQDGLNPILVMGASAIVDRGDVVPRAIVRAGGELVHMGMPVDPGNLMLLARRGETDIIGVPGCARSLKPSGYDWVLQRLAAGLEVGKKDIMRMGAGGLLSEIRARPWPRQAQPEEKMASKIAAVVLAAGQSRRMGPQNKLLADVDGVPMLVRVVRTLQAASIDRIVVVTGHQPSDVQAALSSFVELEFVHNPDYSAGLSTSLRAGIKALDTDVDGALVTLGDMPWVRADHITRLIEAFEPRGICVPVHDRKRGHPVLWGARFFPEFEKLEGDVGARHLLERHADDVKLVPVDDRGIHVDVDTPEALDQLRREWTTTTKEGADVASEDRRKL